MADANFVESGMEHAKRAIAADREAIETDSFEKYEEAYRGYLRAIEYFLTALKYEKNSKTKSIIRQKVEEYMSRAEEIKKALHEPREKVVDTNGRGTGGAAMSASEKKRTSSQGGGNNNDASQEEEKRLRSAIEGAIIREKPNVRWDDVAGLDSAKDALKEAVILPLKFPQLFTGKRKPWRGILLYGPPGTGKSYLAKAVATEADAQFFSVSSADLVSKWMGESERLVRQLFSLARENQPSIIFIDEIDSLCSSRNDSESESARRIKTEFLVQMQGVSNDSDGILVLGATNIPFSLDSAIRRRFERRIYIPLPNIQARERMFQIHIGNTPHELAAKDFHELAMLTEGFSGSDIAVLVRDAIMQPVRTCQNAQTFKKVRKKADSNGNGKLYYTPCSPGDTEAEFLTLMDIRAEELLVPNVSRYDFDKVLANARPSVSQNDIEMHVKFTKEFGQEGN
eukprot:jgi/Galph1/613/GphlegSOOS_G5367.1